MNRPNFRQPLAAILRPTSLKDFYGQEHLLSINKPLANSISANTLQSMLLWGPPGSGKTTLANLLAAALNFNFVAVTATATGTKEIKTITSQADLLWHKEQTKTIVFIDEIHRFNKAQQDVLLPYVEQGSFVLIGATTENPSFSINNALLSRIIIYQLYPLTAIELEKILANALSLLTKDNINITFPQEVKEYFITLADCDARKLLNNLELLVCSTVANNSNLEVTYQLLEQVLNFSCRKFDKHGDLFYEQISALHKAVRGTHPDAALYWFARMIDGGCDTLYIARRVIRMASEDIGNADPRGLQLALNAYDTYQRLGSPEGDLAIAQAICFLSVAPKSNALYTAFNAAKEDAKCSGSLPVPLHLRNAPTPMMKSFGYGKFYKYDHDVLGGVALSQTYFPENFSEKIYYYPREEGLEIQIKQKLDRIRAARMAEK